VFFSREKLFVVQDFVMGMLMPHIDNALRKIQHLEPDETQTSQVVINASELSNRELEIIHWVKSGKTNQEIGLILQISQNTVKSHLKRIFHKLNVSKRAQAVAILSNQ
jgi:DNA-binding CsgD family transcriptional regulator